jgi:phage protein U
VDGMSKIGSFGEIVFEVSPEKTQTFNDFERSGSARWNDHEIIGLKPKSEFSGPGLEEISYVILLKVELGIDPIKQIEKLRKMRDTGKVAPLIIGGKPVSQNYWSIQQLRESHKTVDSKGNILIAEVSVSLKEYYVKQKKIKPIKANSTTNSSSSSKGKSLGRITITVKSVNIRSGPSTNSKVIGYAYKGNILTVQSEKNGWYSLGQGKYITSSSDYSTLKKG